MSKTAFTIHDLNMVSRDYGDLIHVSFRVPDHDVIGLLGLDGSGIELLCRVLRGESSVFGGARGKIWMDGAEVRQASVLAGSVRYIRMADTVLENWTVAEYLGLSRANFYIGKKQKLAMQERAEERFRELGRSVDASRPVRDAGETDRRTARIIHDLEEGVRLLIIEDECLGMTEEEIREYAAVVRKVADSGVSILFRTQSIPISRQICREFLVFRRGRLVKHWRQNETADPALLTQYLLGNTIAEEIKLLRRTQRNIRKRKDVVYQVYDLELAGEKHRYRFYEGEVSAFVIKNILYCREFFDHLSGRKISLSTRYFLGYRELHCQRLKDFIQVRIVSSMLGNEEYELFENMSLEDNLLMPSLQKFSSMQYFQQSDNLHKATRGLVWGDTDKKDGRVVRYAEQSSRIRVDMGRWLMFRPKVLVLYEPFSTCDTYEATLISTYIKQFANMGAAVIVVKSNEEFMLELADHMYKIE